MDEQAARTDIQKLQELLDSTASKSKQHKEKADEYRITFENLEQYPYIMWQLAWELEWDKVWDLHDLHYGGDPKQFMYSTVVISIHPGQILTTVQNAIGFFK